MSARKVKYRLNKAARRRAAQKAAGALPSDQKWVAAQPKGRIPQLLKKLLKNFDRRENLHKGFPVLTEEDARNEMIVAEYEANNEKSPISFRRYVKEAKLDMDHTTLWKLVERSKHHGSVASRKRFCGRKPCLSHERTLEVICAWVHKPWENTTKIAKGLIKRWQFEPDARVPCVKTICKIIDSVRPDAAAILKNELRVYHEKFRLKFRKFYLRPYHTLQLDEHVCDLYAYDPETDEEPFCPWLIAFIDCFTRGVPAGQLLKKQPKTTDILRLLYSAVSAKKDKDNPLVGVPERIQTDNAKVYKSWAFRLSLEWIGAKLHFIDEYSPEQNGSIERFWKICETEFFSGFESYARRKCPKHKLRQNAIPLPLLQTLFQKWLRTYNFERESRSHGMTPVGSYLDARHSVRSRSLPDDDLRKKICLVEERTVQDDGVEFQKRMYTGECLVGWVSAKVIVAKPVLGGPVWVKLPDGKEGKIKLHEELTPTAKDKIKVRERQHREEFKGIRREIDEIPLEKAEDVVNSDIVPVGEPETSSPKREHQKPPKTKNNPPPPQPITVLRVFAKSASVEKPPITISKAA